MTNQQFLIITIILIVIFSLGFIISFSLFILHKYVHNLKAQKKGFMFEDSINNKLKTLLKETDFNFISGGAYKLDKTLYEVDAIFFNKSMLVCAEYKYFQGVLSGDSYGNELNLSNGKNKKLKVKNPITQNESHVKNIFKTTNKKLPYASLIIFPDDLKLEISNIPAHVIICKVNEIESKVNQLYNEASALEQTINIKEFHNTLKAFEISTLAEKLYFRNKIMKQRRKYEYKN